MLTHTFFRLSHAHKSQHKTYNNFEGQNKCFSVFLPFFFSSLMIASNRSCSNSFNWRSLQSFFFQQNFIITAVAFLLNKIVKKKSSEIIVSQEITNNYYRWDFFSCFFHFKSCSYFFRFCIENVEFSALARCCFILLEAFFNRKKQNLLSAIWPINRITTFKRFLKVFKSRWLILNVKAIKKTIFNC